MIALYHQTKILISFRCRQGLNPRSLIQLSETLSVELIDTHIKPSVLAQQLNFLFLFSFFNYGNWMEFTKLVSLIVMNLRFTILQNQSQTLLDGKQWNNKQKITKYQIFLLKKIDYDVLVSPLKMTKYHLFIYYYYF